MWSLKSIPASITRDQIWLSPMHISGLEQGVTALKALAEKDREYLKFLIKEARSNTDLRTTFKSPDGASYVLKIDPKSGDLVIEAPAG